MHRSESWAYTVPLLCLQYCILEDVFMYYILIWFVIYIFTLYCQILFPLQYTNAGEQV